MATRRTQRHWSATHTWWTAAAAAGAAGAVAAASARPAMAAAAAAPSHPRGSHDGSGGTGGKHGDRDCAPSSSSSSSSINVHHHRCSTVDEEGDGGAMPLPLPPMVPARWQHGLSAVGAGVLTAIFTSPFDVIRTRLAVQQSRAATTPSATASSSASAATLTSSSSGGIKQAPPPRPVYHGLIGSFRTTFREEGVRGLYRGFGPTIIVVPSFWAIYFVCYQDLKQRMAATAAQPDQHPWLSRFFTEHVWATHLIAACSAGAVADVVVNPLFVVRTRMQTQHMRLLHGGADSGVLPLASEGPSTSSSSARPQQQQLYTTTRATLVRLVREEGWLSLLRGVSASFLGLTHVAVQFPLYEQFKTSLLQAKIDEMTKSSDGSSGAASSAAAAVRGAPAQEPPCLSMMELIGASALSKVLASSLTFPHEVLRARMQHAPMAVFSSLRDCARKTVRLEGWKALYKGFGVNLVRTVPGAALTLVSYEMILDCLTHAYPSRAKQPC